MSDLVFVEVWVEAHDGWFRVNPDPLDRYTASVVLVEAMRRFNTVRGRLVLHLEGNKEAVEL